MFTGRFCQVFQSRAICSWFQWRSFVLRCCCWIILHFQLFAHVFFCVQMFFSDRASPYRRYFELGHLLPMVNRIEVRVYELIWKKHKAAHTQSTGAKASIMFPTFVFMIVLISSQPNSFLVCNFLAWFTLACMRSRLNTPDFDRLGSRRRRSITDSGMNWPCSTSTFVGCYQQQHTHSTLTDVTTIAWMAWYWRMSRALVVGKSSIKIFFKAMRMRNEKHERFCQKHLEEIKNLILFSTSPESQVFGIGLLCYSEGWRHWTWQWAKDCNEQRMNEPEILNFFSFARPTRRFSHSVCRFFKCAFPFCVACTKSLLLKCCTRDSKWGSVWNLDFCVKLCRVEHIVCVSLFIEVLHKAQRNGNNICHANKRRVFVSVSRFCAKKKPYGMSMENRNK